MFDLKPVRWLFAFIGGLLVVPFVAAETVSLEQAQTAVRNWLSTDPALGCPLGMSVRSARTSSVTNGATCHVVQLAEGGFVVTSTDTRLEPVIAFSEGSDLVEDDRNPLWALLKRDLALRAETISTGGASLQSVAPAGPVRTESEVKWARLLSAGARMQAVTSVSDVRVAPFVKSKWNQTTCSSGKCYNYYTPNNYYCGCVATAGAQMMRYFQWPKATTSIVPYTCKYCKVDNVWTTLTTQGGSYDWAQMPLDPNLSGTTEANRQMIGKLTSDIGIICGMSYGSGGSGTGGYMLDFAFKKFGYSNIMTYVSNSDLSNSSDMKNALLSNFDAKLPVLVSIEGISDGHTIGHAIVGDGYGYSDNTLYIHLNYGWGGTGTAWYAPPSLNAGGNSFSVLDGFDYNVYTNQTAGSVICSGRVLTASGAPVARATIRASLSGRTSGTAMTDENGIYALYLAANSKPYTLTATFGFSTATDSVVVKACTTMSLCSDGNADYGKYYTSPRPTVGNVWGKDLVLSNLPSVETPVLAPADCVFWPTTNVTISCATAGATIRYTLDGEDPTETSPAYSTPIDLVETTTVKARAFKSGFNPSIVASAVYTYDITRDAPQGDYFANPILISGESGSYVVADNSRYALEDDEPLHTLSGGSYYNQAKTIWYQWTAPRNGTVAFTTKCYLVTTSGNTTTTSRKPTYVAVYMGDDLKTATRLGMSTAIQQSDYSTTVRLEVAKDVTYRIVGMVGNDAYVGAFTLSWSGTYEAPIPTETSTTDVPVPFEWLDRHFPGTHGAADYETIAHADSDGDGFPTWQEYVLDTDPNDPASTLRASIRLEGETPVVEWNHTNATIEALGYRYVPKGRVSLADGDWISPVQAMHRFFKVFVEKK